VKIILITRKWAIPNKNTFQIQPIKELIEKYYQPNELWLNPFANTSKYGITNDIDPDFDTDYNLDATDFLKLFEDNSIDGILYDPPFCYDEQTEIFTKKGWAPIKEVSINDEVATLTDEGDMEWNNPVKIIKKYYEGSMVEVDSQSINLLVTPNHKMWVKNNFYGDFKFVDAESMFKKTKKVWFKKAPNMLKNRKEDVCFFTLPPVSFIKSNRYGEKGKPEKQIPMDIWLRFLGTYLTEGCCDSTGTNYRIRLAQKCPKGRKFIENILIDLGYNYIKSKKEFTIYDKQLWSYVNQFGKSKNKYIPSELKETLSVRQLTLLFDTMMYFDGTNIEYPKYNKEAGKWYSYKTNNYYTVSKRLADDIYEIVLYLGFGATIRKKNDVYDIKILKAKDFRVNKKDVNIINNWKGDIYCVTVPNSKVLVKRNNRTCWCGNSPRQISECYKRLDKSVNMQTTQSSYWTKHKKAIAKIVKKDGIVISCAWNSGGIGKTNGFKIIEILLVPHGGWHNDTIITVERKVI